MFLNAIMLAGLSAAVLPIVLHLLNRARYRRVEWGAMMFLQDTVTRQLDRSKLAQWLLLALRVLAIALIAIALARPVTQRAFGPADAQRLAAVVVIDASPSMTHPENSASRLDLARRAALGVLGKLRRGDQAALVTLGQASDKDVALTTDLQEIASRLASLQPAYGQADLADGVRRAATLLAPAGDVPREVYLISDRQESAWRNLPQLPPNLRQRMRLIGVPVGSTENHNAWIESVALTSSPAIAGMPADLEIRIRNGGSIPRSDLPVTITLDNKELDRASVYIAPGATEVVRRRVTIPKAGSVVLSAAIGSSGLPGDDTAMLAIDVMDPTRVVVLTSEASKQAQRVSPDFSGEADYLRLALTPFAISKEKGEDAFRLRVLSQDEWPELEKRDRVVVLADINRMDERRLRALEQFVFAGGGLLLAPGPRTEAKFWNQWFWRDGAGLAPAPLDSVKSAGDDVVRLVGVASSHEVFSFFAGRPDPLPPVSVLRWARFAPVSPGAVLASLQSGDPMLVHRAFGRGRVIALAVPIDTDWSNFAWSNLYLPTMQSVVRYLGAARAADRNLALGTAIETSFDLPRERAASIARPDGLTERATMSMSGGVGTIIYPNTDIAGRYTVRAGGLPPVDFIVRGGAEESELNLLDQQKLEKLAASADVTLADPELVSEMVGRSRRSTELSLAFLAAALGVLGIELMLAQRTIPPAEEAIA